MPRKPPSGKGAVKAALSELDLVIVTSFYGFDLRSFDRWLSELQECPNKSDLIKRRARAIEGLSEGNDDATRERFEYLVLRRRALENALEAGPIVRRDAKRKATAQKQRRSEIDAWIKKELARNPKAKSPELWKERPEFIRNPREYEPIGERRFASRVTGVRKGRRGNI